MAKVAKKKAVKKQPPKKAAKPRPLATIGYEQAVQSRVIEALNHAKIDILVDVRAVAASRKPGFSKNQLAVSLDDKGIAYLHFQKLGTPKEGRETNAIVNGSRKKSRSAPARRLRTSRRIYFKRDLEKWNPVFGQVTLQTSALLRRRGSRVAAAAFHA